MEWWERWIWRRRHLGSCSSQGNSEVCGWRTEKMVLAFLFRWHTYLLTILQHKTVNWHELSLVSRPSSPPVFKWSKSWGEEGLGKRLTLTTCGAKSVSSTWHASITMLGSSPWVASIEGMPCQINLLHIRSITRCSASSLTTMSTSLCAIKTHKMWLTLATDSAHWCHNIQSAIWSALHRCLWKCPLAHCIGVGLASLRQAPVHMSGLPWQQGSKRN